MKQRKGFTLIELLVVVAIIALLISILLPSLARARELAKRAVCRANMRGIGQSCYIYANDYSERFPVALFDRSIAGKTSYTLQYADQYGYDADVTPEEEFTDEDDAGTVPVTRSMFLLVIQGATSPKQFICPSSSDNADDLRNDNGDAASPGQDRFDFKDINAISYGYQLPYHTVSGAVPSTDMDVRMALGADKGPYAEDLTRPVPEGSSEDDMLRMSNEAWQPYNSQNHSAGEGQAVLFVDGHVDFERKPIVGITYDNIYTVQTGNELLDVMQGDAPDDLPPGNTGTGTNSSTGDTDSVIVP